MIVTRARAAGRVLAILVLLCVVGAACQVARPQAGPATASDTSCEPVDGLEFVCGAERPEDLALIPGTRWIIASGFSAGAGLKLVDTRTRTLRRWYTGEASQIQPNKARFPHCPAALDARLFNVQGIHLRTDSDGSHLLYATNHGGRESVEVFRIRSGGDEPTLQWIGCVLMPEGMAANSVVSAPTGAILVTVLLRPGTQIGDFVQGKTTGRVYEWTPGTPEFRYVQGADLPGNNGLELSKDGKEFYVVAFGWRAVVTFSHTNPAQLLRKAVAPGFMPDNIHWDGEELIVAGMQYDEPACGGLRKIIDGKADPMLCHRGYVVARLTPSTMTYSVLAYAEPNAAFSGVSTGLVVDGKLWLGSFQADRIAVRSGPLPGS